MLRPVTLLVLAVAATVGGLVGEALHFNSTAYFGVLLAVMFAASLSDLDRFWGADLRRRHPPQS